jgi:hypothetical protein
VRAAFLAAFILSTVAVYASDAPAERSAAQLRLEGSFAPTARTLAGGYDAIRMSIGGHDRWFSARVARTVGGDQPRSGRDVLNALAPFETSMHVVGSADLVRRIDDAPDGVPMSVEGLVDIESRSYLLRSIVIGSPPSS